MFRPFISDPSEELLVDAPDRFEPVHGDLRLLFDPLEKRTVVAAVERERPTRGELMFVKPMFDNIPAY